MVFVGSRWFLMGFRWFSGKLLGQCLALNHQPSLAISLEKGLATTSQPECATARALNLTMLKSRWYTEYS